jgi:hypothetical protein
MTENINFNIAQSSIIKNATNPTGNLAITTPAKSKPSSSAIASTPKSATSTFKLSSATLSRSALKKIPYPTTPSTPRARSPSTASSTSLSSVSREAARLAKEQNTKERIEKVQQLKLKWAQEKEDRIQSRQRQQSDKLQKQSQISSKLEEQRKQNLERQREYEWNAKAAEREALAAYSKDRSFAKAETERIEKEKKRFSIMLRSELNMKFQRNSSLLENAAKEEDLSLYESRRLDAEALKEQRMREDEKRRESIMFRVQSSHKQRLIQQTIDEEQADYERSLIQTRYLSWKDEQQHREIEEAQRRISLMNRGETWRRQRQQEAEEEAIDKEEELMRLQARYEDWKDIEEYKKRQQQRDRESLQGRWEKYLKDREYDLQVRIHEDEVQEYESEMKRQAAEDLALYQEALKERSRMSLAYRLDKAKKDRIFDDGKKAIEQELLLEEQKFRQQDMQDVETYVQKIANDRRQSLEYRNQLEFQERMRLEGERYNQLEKEAIDRELTVAAWQDVQAYQERCREERRQSLAQRLVESRQQKQRSLEEHRLKLDALHDEFNTRRLDWSAEEMAEDEKKRRRFSLALRLDSWRMQRLAEEKLKEKKRMIEEENIRCRMQDWEDLQRAKEELKLRERANLLNKMIF